MLENMAEKILFSTDIRENETIMRRVFEKDDIFILRKLRTMDGGECFIAYFDGMVNIQVLDLNVVQPVQNEPQLQDLQYFLENVISTEQVKLETDPEKAFLAMEMGDALFFADGSAAALSCSAKGFRLRSVEEPDVEKYLRGPKEGFTESLIVNSTLLRRRLVSKDLKMEIFNPVENSGERFALCYLQGIVDEKLLCTIRKRLASIALPSLLSSNHLEEAITPKWQLFKTVGVTEKPDIAAAKILEGRVAIICDGSPNVLTAPFLFLEYFQIGSDYYGNFWFGSVARLLRIIGTFLSVSVPAIYVSLVCFHQEMLPTELLVSIQAAREGVPLPTVFETFLMLVAFELLRNAGITMPKGIGDALSTVGGVVIGQAAVDARFISSPLVIMIAFTGLTELLIPKLKGPVFLIRLYLLALASFVGIYGYIIGMLSVLALLAGKDSFGLPYLMYLDTLEPGNLRDTVVRAPMRMLRMRSVRRNECED